MLAIADYSWKTIEAKPPGWPSTTTDSKTKTKAGVQRRWPGTDHYV